MVRSGELLSYRLPCKTVVKQIYGTFAHHFDFFNWFGHFGANRAGVGIVLVCWFGERDSSRNRDDPMWKGNFRQCTWFVPRDGDVIICINRKSICNWSFPQHLVNTSSTPV